MHLLVTGGCGYVGSCLTKRLLNDGHKVTVVDILWFGNYLGRHKNLDIIQNDIRDVENISMKGVDVVIHLAAISNDPTSDLDPKLTWEVNVLATMHLIEKAVASGVREFIFASSGSVYGVKDEDDVTEDLSLVPISDYNKTKMLAERVLLSYKDKIIINIIRPATVCGYSPRMRLDLSVNMLTMQALVNGRITVFGGSQIRPNIHIRDMVELYLHFLSSSELEGGIFNAGFENLSIMSIAKKVAEHVPAEIIRTNSDDPRSYRVNSDKLINSGFYPSYGVEDAIQEIIEEYNAGRIEDEDGSYNIRVMKKSLAS